LFLCVSLEGSACQPLMPLMPDSDCLPRGAQLILRNPYDALQKSLRHPDLRHGVRFSLLRFGSRFVRVQSGTDDASRLATVAPVLHEGDRQTDVGEVLSPTVGTILIDRLEVDAVISGRLVVDDIIVAFMVDRIDPDGAVDDAHTNERGVKRIAIGKFQPIPYESHVESGSVQVRPHARRQ
jgi:hypothetical protein